MTVRTHPGLHKLKLSGESLRLGEGADRAMVLRMRQDDGDMAGSLECGS